jgi:amphi-Trp domain-containing protein
MKRKDEVEKGYSTKDVVDKLRRLADALEKGESLRIQIKGKRISIPPSATVEFEYEQKGNREEVEIELKWKRK